MKFQAGHKINLGRKRGAPSLETRMKMSIARKGQPVSAKTKLRISEALKGRKITWGHKISKEKLGVPNPKRGGINSPFWKGGITPETKRIRSSLEYMTWRRSVFGRDNYTCVWCGARSGNGKAVVLHADHIKPFSLFPELRFTLNNGRTLCAPCHKTTDTFAHKIRNKTHLWQQ